MNTPAMSVRRPGGITASCLILGVLAIAGFVNAFLLSIFFSAAVSPRLLRAPSLVVSGALAAMAAAYGGGALTAAVGLWRMRQWAPRAHFAWIAVACCSLVLSMYLVRLPANMLMLGATCAVLMAALCGAWWLYIRRAYLRASAGAL